MKVLLAGFNLDYETIRELEKKSGMEEPLTPETISAAYARISRNPLPVNELRDISRREVNKARKSNETIVFDMGHSSVAEHAVFNIDVIGVSRLIVEEIEKFRLCSYTEKSQRYIRLEDDFVIPAEIRGSGLEKPFRETIQKQNAFYHVIYQGLRSHVFARHGDLAANPANHSMLDGWAKEDARYVVSLATETQLGMTLNARNLELMLRRAASHPLREVNDYGRQLYGAAKHVAPSLVRYTDATAFDRLRGNELAQAAARLTQSCGHEGAACAPPANDECVTLAFATPEGDECIVASLLHTSTALPFGQCMARARGMSRAEKESLLQTSMRHMESYDLPPREFERASLTYEMVISASCFAQLKRHRMATILSQDYDPTLGVTIPPAVRDIGMDDRFMELMHETHRVYDSMRQICPEVSAYVLTNAHRKRVSCTINVRELYHISRLREDRSAQWDIRETARHMVSLGRSVMPLALMLASGKDEFPRLRAEIIHQD